MSDKKVYYREETVGSGVEPDRCYQLWGDQLWVLQVTVELYQCKSDLQVQGDESGSEELVSNLARPV